MNICAAYSNILLFTLNLFTPMNILLLGSGGREHAFAHSLSQSPLCEKLYIAPGNAGTALVGENLAFAATDFAAIKQCCLIAANELHDLVLCLGLGLVHHIILLMM